MTNATRSDDLDILQLKEILRSELISILDSIRGSKALVLDPDLSGPLSFIVDFSVLKEHGVEKVFLLDSIPPEAGAIKGLLYFSLPHTNKMKTIAEHIRAGSSSKEYSLQLVPRRTLLCERVLEEEGVLGDLTVGEYRMDFIPLEDDLLSLELPATFKELYLEGDFSSIYYAARGIMRLQGLYGFFPRIVGKGDFAQILADTLTRMRLELTSSNPRGSSSSALAMSSVFDSMVVIDRGVDMVTPLLTQLTYEGLVSEVYGINNGYVSLSSLNTSDANQASTSGSSTTPAAAATAAAAPKRRRIALNSSDSIFSDIRNMNFAGVGNLLSKMSRQLQDTYESRHKAKTVQEIRSFVGKLNELQAEHQSLKSHVSLAETILKRTQTDDFNHVLEIEQSLVSNGDISKDQLAYLDKLLALADPHAPVPGCNGELKDSPPTTAPNSIHKVLRLMCLYSLWRGPSFKQKVYDAWYEELVDAFGHHQTITLDNLEAVGLLVSPANNTGGTSASTAKPSMLKLAAGGDVNSVGILNSIVPSTKPRNPVHSNPLSFLRKTLNLINSDVRENDPDDISYVYSGYAPLSVRLLQCLVRDPAVYTSSSTASRYASLLRGGSSSDTTRPAQKDLQSGGVKSGWKGWEDVLAELPGETVDVTQWNDREGDLLSSDSVVQRLGEKAPATLVLFLGGCTFTEIAALRLLSQQHNHRYIAATTQIINGNSFIDSLILKASN